MTKIDDIKALKQAKEVQDKQQESAVVFYSRMLTPENRQEVVMKISNFINESDMKLEEFLLGMCDYSSSVLISHIADNMVNEEELKDSEQRYIDLRIKLADTLNQVVKEADVVSMGENIIAMLSLVSESVVMVADSTIKHGIED